MKQNKCMKRQTSKVKVRTLDIAPLCESSPKKI